MRFHSSCLFDIGKSLLVDFDFCRANNYVTVGLCKLKTTQHNGLNIRDSTSNIIPFVIPFSGQRILGIRI